MDVFKLRDQPAGDYRHYAESLLMINDERTPTCVERDLDDRLLWPDPALQLDPAFESGGQVEELAPEGPLRLCSRWGRGHATGSRREYPTRTMLVLFHRSR